MLIAHLPAGYLTHRPIMWVIVMGIGFLFGQKFLIGVGLGGTIHLGLDSIAGQVTWGWPVWDHSTTLAIVPATRDHWVLSFLNHWTFQVELAICAIALIVFWRKGLQP